MKKIIYFLTLLVFAFTSCVQDEIIDPTSDQEVELIGTTLKGKLDKVTICHYDVEMDIWKSISINGNALKAHLNHGDVVGDCISCPIYLDDNGVTIKCYDWGNVGDTGEINGITYTIVDETGLRQMINNGEDITKVCTTKVTNMREMFEEIGYDPRYKFLGCE